MHIFSISGLITFIVLLVGCTSPENQSLEGTWQLVEGKNVAPDTTVIYSASPEAHHMKIIGQGHFATVWQDTAQNSSGFNGGSYTFEDGVYTESITLFSLIDWIGRESYFLAEIDGNRLLLTPANAKGEAQQYGWFEEYERVE
ncbi:MAG: hypothetical protein GF372_12635 [Candidatus Marinimicrobia bacterium]|nr:hypothetical protein [Candidatus Neomarinimicrobiota bacterium]